MNLGKKYVKLHIIMNHECFKGSIQRFGFYKVSVLFLLTMDLLHYDVLEKLLKNEKNSIYSSNELET